jgi:hypothetical protein
VGVWTDFHKGAKFHESLSTWRRADTFGRTDGVKATHDEANSGPYLFMRMRLEQIVVYDNKVPKRIFGPAKKWGFVKIDKIL